MVTKRELQITFVPYHSRIFTVIRLVKTIHNNKHKGYKKQYSILLCIVNNHAIEPRSPARLHRLNVHPILFDKFKLKFITR